MTINVTNGTLTSVSGALHVYSNEFLPETITVTGASSTYNPSTGAYAISSPTSSTIGMTAVGEWAFNCTVSQLSGYSTLSGGTHTIQVRALASGYAVGELSDEISFDVPYTVSYNLTGCSVSAQGASSASELYPSGTLTLNISEYSGYELPSSVTVTGATSVYSQNDKTLTLSNPTGNVSVTITCVVVVTGHDVTVSGFSYHGASFYDGQDSNAPLLITTANYSDYTHTLVCQSGYIYMHDSGDAVHNPGTCSSGISIASYDEYHALYSVTADGSITGIYYYPCLIAGTKIMLADGTEKNIEDISYSDDLLVYDFYNRCYTSAKPMWIKKKQTTSKYDKVVFSDGSWLGVVGNNGNTHRLFNFTKQEFLYPKDCIGDSIFTYGEADVGIESITTINETVDFYNVITEKHYNLFANGILTSCRLSNRYAIDCMKYDTTKVKMTEEEVQEYISKLQMTLPREESK